MENQSQLPLAFITIRLRKALHLESTIWDITEKLEELSEQGPSASHYNIFKIYQSWLEIFQITIEVNIQHWKNVRHEKIRSIIHQCNGIRSSKRTRIE